MGDEHKAKGNELLRQGKVDEAIAEYTAAIECGGPSLGIYYNNRAAALLQQQQWQRAQSDAREAYDRVLEAAGRAKAAYRACRAAAGRLRWVEALQWADQGLQLAPKDAKMRQLREECQERVRDQIRRQDDQQELMSDKKERLKLFVGALQRRRWALGKQMRYPTPYNDSKKIGMGYDDKADVISFPVIFFYPEYRQTDMISPVLESDTLQATLEKLFPASMTTPLPFDSRRVMLPGNMKNWVIVVKTNDFENHTLLSKWVEVDPKQTFDEIFRTPEYVIPKWPCIFIYDKEWPGRTLFRDKCE